MQISKNIKLSWKLATIGVAFVLPLGVLLFIAIQNINGQIAFSRLETQGNTFQRPLEKLLEDLPRAASDPAAASRVDQAFAELADAAKRHGDDLQFTAEGLGIRNRSHLTPQAVAARWTQARASQGDPAAFKEKTAALVDDVMGMITHAGDTSNLILDPDLDSYYMMDLTLLALPQTQRRLASILDFGDTALGGSLSEEDRRQFHTLAEMLSESDFSRILADTETTLNEDPNFYGVSPNLARNMAAGLSRYKAATEPFIALLKSLAAGEPVTREAFLASGQAARDAAFRYWEVCADELDAFLAVRIGDYTARRTTMLAATGLALVLASALAYLIGRGVSRTITKMVAFARDVAGGDLGATLQAGGSTAELNQLRTDMETMVATLKEKLGFVQGILGGITMPCLVVSPEGRITYLNTLLCHFMSKDKPARDYMGMHISEFFASNRAMADLILKTLQGRTLVTNQGFEGTDARNERFFIKIDAAPIFDLENRALGCFAQFAVLTEVKRQEETLIETNKVICETAEQAGAIAAQVAAAAAELSSVVEQTGKGMDVQRSRTGETATAMQQMNATVLEVAKNASGAAEQAELTMRKAREGADTVHQSVTAIGRVKSQTDILKNRIATLGEQAAGIGRIMNVISDIADQTNLLALNAAIEAARAGDAGRGFAVVADEVRKLAEKTMHATTEVGDSITAIQAGAREAVSGMDEASRAVAEATRLADHSGVALREILELAGHTNDQVRSIAAAAEEQSAASEEIHRAVDEVSHVAEETSQGVDRSMQAVERLASQAEALDHLIRNIGVGNCLPA
ncbi:MAG: methyl-accepting chemotaxis protein [Desulfovibrionaceae bacterium]|nr:methyl-accepting chemotaxis protein [Desulfovibrionaceae bacterium]